MSVLQKRLFTVEEYYKMGLTGILRSGDRVELIEGEIIQMSPIGPVHAACVDRLTELLLSQLSGRAKVRGQNPIRLNDTSEPEPDVCVVRPRTDFYRDGHPQPQDVFLVVEVADSTVRGDREIKIPLYARSQIPEVWLLNLPEQCLEVYRDPTPEGYRQVQRLQEGDIVTLQSFPDIQFTIEQLLG
ncbi:Uma2 family endonuclease [Roseofilum casamattae]|uniref:Uma2 family endonuclease n=1 Tax=Roseofilum casamattae BLCC-M143 TaxID=3022442 RepID=A0ABT7BZN4_9CYAN|nr:Uma2 family endonuclease [Roseofilum casamattae]MDJ1184661.1 Uma2 family endonuclease [Roseofilum casamattae BLCC-M143]